MLTRLVKLFEVIETFWHSPRMARWTSVALITGFTIGLALALLSYFGLISPVVPFFISIDIAFTVLLFFEILGLIFILPKSVADSVGKQFEIFSIILLRSAFKEFGETNGSVTLESLSDPDFYHMYYDAFGALLIFLVIGFYYKVQKHERITDTEKEQVQFIRFKQLLAICILIVFFAIGAHDVYQWLMTGDYYASIHTFYLFLIFTDILILLYSLRYTSRYFNIFRYSSFAFATVLVRLALSSGPLVNVLLGLVSGLFVLGLSIAYNYFIAKRIHPDVH
jgi:hypothetical protein